MDRCVMRKMASAKTHSFFTLLFYSHHPSHRISVRLVIWMGIQWTTLIITEEDEQGINNTTEARGKRKRARRRGKVNQRERLVERLREFRKHAAGKKKTDRTVRNREDKKKGRTHKMRTWKARRERRRVGRGRDVLRDYGWGRENKCSSFTVPEWQDNCESCEKIYSQGVKIYAIDRHHWTLTSFH